MASFDIYSTSDIAKNGWGDGDDGIDLWDTINEDPYSDSDNVEISYDQTGILRLGGVSLPGDFPDDGVDSLSMSVRGYCLKDRADSLDLNVKITDSSDVVIATWQNDLTTESATTFSGLMSITGTNTDVSWAGHRITLDLDYSGSSVSTAHITYLRITASYTPDGGGGANSYGTLAYAARNASKIILPGRMMP